MNINWTPPVPRPGWRSEIDKFLGPGTTRAELALELAAALLAPLLLLLYAQQADLGWTGWQPLAAALLAFDLAGGVVTNAANAAKRWYHRPAQGPRQHLLFVALHVHPFLVAWLFQGGDWSTAWFGYGYLLLAALVIVYAPLYLKRPFAMLLLLGGLALGLYVVQPAPGMEWFLPTFYLKLLVSHLLPEAPFAPD